MLLEQSTSGHLAPQVSQFLKDNKRSLQQPDGPFKNAADSAKPGASTSLVVKLGAHAKVGRDAQVEDVAQRFEIDKDQASTVLHSLGRSSTDTTTLSDRDWDRLTAYIFEERMAVIGIVAWILRARKHRHKRCNFQPDHTR